MDLIRKDPSKKILLSALLPIEFIRKQRPEVDVLLKRATVRFMRSPCTLDEIINSWSNLSEHVVDANALEAYNQRQIASILHILKVADPKQPKNDNEQAMVDRTVAEAKSFFPSLVSASDHEVIDFLFEASNGRPLVKKGEWLEGVFCDIDGTLIIDGNINEKTLSLLKKYDSEGKQITLWTDGDVKVTESILTDRGISYPLVQKIDYAGAEVEIAIDDFDEFAFTARTKITARTFVPAP